MTWLVVPSGRENRSTYWPTPQWLGVPGGQSRRWGNDSSGHRGNSRSPQQACLVTVCGPGGAGNGRGRGSVSQGRQFEAGEETRAAYHQGLRPTWLPNLRGRPLPRRSAPGSRIQAVLRTRQIAKTVAERRQNLLILVARIRAMLNAASREAGRSRRAAARWRTTLARVRSPLCRVASRPQSSAVCGWGA